jgi:hypothetical protein
VPALSFKENYVEIASLVFTPFKILTVKVLAEVSLGNQNFILQLEF